MFVFQFSESDLSKPDAVVGKVSGVEIIEFRSPKVFIDKSILIGMPEKKLKNNIKNVSSTLCSIPKRRRGRPRKVPILEEKSPTDISSRNRKHSGETPYLKDGSQSRATSTNQRRSQRTGLKPTKVLSDISSEYSKTKRRKRPKRQLSDERKTTCPICRKAYPHNYMDDHFEKMHQVRSDVPVQDDHKCPITGCLAKIRSRVQLKRHFIVHLENNPYICKVPGCGFKADALCHLKRHLRQHTGADLFQCPKCKVCYTKKKMLDNHKCIFDPNLLIRDVNGFLRMKTGQSRYTDMAVPCDILNENETIVNINQVIQNDPVYLRVVKENPEFENAIFGESSSHLIRVKAKGITTKSYKCDPCATLFFEKKVWITHKKTCEVKPKAEPASLIKLGCPLCGGSFDSFEDLVNHARRDHPSRIYSCVDCERLYSTGKVLERHLERHEKPFGCMRCPRRFPSKPEQTKHKKKCTSKWECSKCGKALQSLLSLKRHWKTMHGVTVENKDYQGQGFAKIKPRFTCKSCATAFSDKYGMATHQKICVKDSGSGGVKLGCPVCGKTYENFKVLVEHVEWLHPFNVFKCDDCERLYSRKTSLSKHLELHKRRYRCPVCNLRFESESERDRHKTTCVAVQKVSCDQRTATRKPKKINKIASHFVEEESEPIVKTETAEEEGSLETGSDTNSGLEQPVDILIKEEEDSKPVIVNHVDSVQEHEFFLL